MKKTILKLAALCSTLCLAICLIPAHLAAQTAGTDDLTSLRTLYEAALELETDTFRPICSDYISIREVPEEATDTWDILVVTVDPDADQPQHTAELVLQMFIRGDKVCTLRQELLLTPGEKQELMFRASAEDLLSGCFRVFLEDGDDARLSDPDQCYPTLTLPGYTGGGSMEGGEPYVPAPAEEPETEPDHQQSNMPSSGGKPNSGPGSSDPWEDEVVEEPNPTLETQPAETECPPMPDVHPSDDPLPTDEPTLPAAPTTQPPSQEGDNNTFDDEFVEFEDE